ncbi:hypothetical protein BAY61_09670 [Prauserella marina]|uniref:Uncharacterized protein n=1 Tax=Prauserella marina TaxID=530584 RepID=A0A222VNB2_9PSEU|nr:hypothetical protein [Prauserella marina]ASR35211.1 hypothetical protein BAY61_09670 [Prauserella marina]PWV85021.1 hypothetical protein DES30_1011041 [Prauserella marina]SDC06654.1 hypothetical protein SAMN05421630_101295 [Prauserella marina]
MTDDLERATREQLRHGLRVAMLVVTVVIVFGLSLSNLVRGLGTFPLPWAQLAAFAVLAAVLSGEAVLLVRKKTWNAARRVAVVAILTASALSYVTLPDGRTSTALDWAFGAANWVGIVVLFDRPFRSAVLFLLAHESVALANLVVVQGFSKEAFARFATGSVTVIGFPLCAAVVAAALGRIGSQAAAAAREVERVRTKEAVAVESHRRRARRFADLSGTTVPLLEGLADGSLRPDDVSVQRRCAIEAARMRRLFAELDTVADPLLHELRHCADVADRRGVEVELDARGRLPDIPVAVRRDLTEVALTALATAESWARVTVIGNAGLVSVNVVADCADSGVPVPATRVSVATYGTEGTVWMEATWQPGTS